MSNFSKRLELIYFLYLAALPCVGTYLLYTLLPTVPVLWVTWLLGIPALAIYIASFLSFTPALTSPFQNLLRLLDGPFWFIIAITSGDVWTHLLIEIIFSEMLIVLVGQTIAGLLIFRRLRQVATPEKPGPAPLSLLVLLGPTIGVFFLAFLYFTQLPEMSWLRLAFWIVPFGQGLFTLLVQQKSMRTDTAQRDIDNYIPLIALTPVVWCLMTFVIFAYVR